MLRTNVTKTQEVKDGDMVQVYNNDRIEKTKKRSSPRSVLSLDIESGTV